MPSVHSHLGMSAVVQQDNMSSRVIAVYPLARVTLNVVCGSFSPVEAGYVPHDWLQSELAGNLQYRRPSRAEWRTKESWLGSSCVSDGFRTVHELPAQLRATEK